MSHISGGKSTDAFSKKSHFYVEFLGWMECRGLRGQRYTDPIMRDLRRRHKMMEATPKLTIEVSKKDVKITQELHEKHKRGIKKIKFPTIRARDVTYVRQATRPSDGSLDDTVACIYLGYMPRTQRYVHVHVYRFDEAKTAALFSNQMSSLVDENFDRIRQVEIELTNSGEIDDPRLMSSDLLSEPRTSDSALGSTSSAGSDNEYPNSGGDEIDADLQSLKDFQPFESVTDELKFRLQIKDSPILLPPKDYDTIRRGHGNLEQINRRRCLNLNIVGENAITREINGSDESGVELISPDSASAEVDETKNSKLLPLLKPSENGNSFVRASIEHSKQKLTNSGKHFSQTSQSEINYNIPKQSHKSNKPIVVGDNSHQLDFDQNQTHGGHSSGSRSPETSLTSEIVYPSNMANLAFRQGLYTQPQKVFQNRRSSEHSKLPHNFDEGVPAGPIRYCRSVSVNDIYSAPFRISPLAPGQVFPQYEIPPDYYDDFRDQPKLRGMKQRYGERHFTRVSSHEVGRSEAIQDRSSRPVSGDLQYVRRISQPYGEYQLYSNGGILPNHPLEKVVLIKRN